MGLQVVSLAYALAQSASRDAIRIDFVSATHAHSNLTRSVVRLWNLITFCRDEWIRATAGRLAPSVEHLRLLQRAFV